ncbi:hypothetical protein B296_00043804 [Ensete ventricosum]|uniref:Uncharacterized protein n=1 Tax=Ensete ventricosum TaxID=4639 RepID=A0A426X0E0_ENSVE|nr:hypothetical protein B296_00043804 [Ensete ventricosum]
MAGRGATHVLHTSWFNCSSWIRAKEIAAIRVYNCRAFTSPRISDFRPSIKVPKSCAVTVCPYGSNFLRAYPRRMIGPRGMKDKGRSLTSHLSPHTKKLTRDELHECSTKVLCWHCDELWSREHCCKKGRLLVIEPVEDDDSKPSEDGLEPEEEAMEEEP